MSSADQQAAPEQHRIPGQTLAAQREAMGWTVEQVADQLKLAVRQVVALEAGDYASLPSPAVTRGFVRAYAKIMRLDPAPLVAQIDLGTPGPNDSSGALRRERPASFSEVRFPRNSQRKGLPVGLIAGAVVAVIALGAAGWKFGLVPGLGRTVPAAVTASGAAASNSAVLTTTPAAPVANTAAQELQSTSVPLISVPPPSSNGNSSAPNVGTPSGVAPATATPTSVAPAVAPATPAAAPVAAPAAGGNALVVAVREDSWVEVRKASGGKPLFARMVKAGSTETFDVAEPVTMVVGKPDAVSATLRGTAVDLPLMPGKKFSRVALK